MLKLPSALVLVTALLVPPTSAAASQATAHQTATSANAWQLPGVGTVGASIEEADGRLRLRVTSGSTEAVSVADLGFVTAAGDLSKDLVLRSEQHSTLRTAYKMTTGKQRQRSVFQQESRLAFGNATGSFMLVVRVSDDGVGFRYELPGPVTVQRETGGYEFAPDATNWLQPTARSTRTSTPKRPPRQHRPGNSATPRSSAPAAPTHSSPNPDSTAGTPAPV